jgi:hypothetical protein
MPREKGTKYPPVFPALIPRFPPLTAIASGRFALDVCCCQSPSLANKLDTFSRQCDVQKVHWQITGGGLREARKNRWFLQCRCFQISLAIMAPNTMILYPRSSVSNPIFHMKRIKSCFHIKDKETDKR